VYWVEALVNGVLLGGLYAMYATGLSLVFGIMRLVNLAHGDFIVFAGYIILTLTTLTGAIPVYVLPAAMVVVFVFGYLLQYWVLNRTLGSALLPPILVTFGLSVLLQNGMIEIFSADNQRLPIRSLETEAISVGPLTVGLLPLATFATAVLVIYLLNILIYKSELGRVFRATSDNPEIARLMGVNTKHVYAIAMGIAMMVLAIAALLSGARATFDPTIGPGRLIYAFEAVIIGGLGSLWGTLIGGIILGVAQTVGGAIKSDYQVLAGHVTFILVLLVRPKGLFPK